MTPLTTKRIFFYSFSLLCLAHSAPSIALPVDSFCDSLYYACCCDLYYACFCEQPCCSRDYTSTPYKEEKIPKLLQTVNTSNGKWDRFKRRLAHLKLSFTRMLRYTRTCCCTTHITQQENRLEAAIIAFSHAMTTKSLRTRERYLERANDALSDVSLYNDQWHAAAMKMRSDFENFNALIQRIETISTKEMKERYEHYQSTGQLLFARLIYRYYKPSAHEKMVRTLLSKITKDISDITSLIHAFEGNTYSPETLFSQYWVPPLRDQNTEQWEPRYLEPYFLK